MTELEKIQRAKMYIDKLANGIDPLTDRTINENDIVNNVRISRCFNYISDILLQVIDNRGVVGRYNGPKLPFIITPEQLSQYEFSDIPIPVSGIAERINKLIDVSISKDIRAVSINNWLVTVGYMRQLEDSEGKKYKCPTDLGLSHGLSVEYKTSFRGNYTLTLFDKSAQQFIIDNFTAVAEIENQQSVSKQVE